MSATSLNASIIQANGRVIPKIAHLSCGHEVHLNNDYYRLQKLLTPTFGKDTCPKCYTNFTIVSVRKEEVKETDKKAQQIAQPELTGVLPPQPVDAETLYQEGVKEFEEQNYEAAVKLLTKAAHQDNSKAYYKLGLCYYYELGVPEIDPKTGEDSTTTAFILFKKAANRGLAEAKFVVGFCYAYGLGVEQNDKKAFEWYGRGAMSGHVESMKYVAMCYHTGTGVSANENKRIAWLAKAADQGDLEAAKIYEDSIKELEAINDEHDAAEAPKMSIYEFFKSIDPNTTQNIIKKRNEYLRKFHGNQDAAIQAAIADNRQFFSVATGLSVFTDMAGTTYLKADHAHLLSLFRESTLEFYLKGWHEMLLIAALNGYDLENDPELFIKMSCCSIMAALFSGFVKVIKNGVPGLKREAVKEQLRGFVKTIPLELTSKPWLNSLLKVLVDQLIVEGGTTVLTGLQPAICKAVDTVMSKLNLPLSPVGTSAVTWTTKTVLTFAMSSLIDHLTDNYSNCYTHAIVEFETERREIPEEEYAD